MVSEPKMVSKKTDVACSRNSLWAVGKLSGKVNFHPGTVVEGHKCIRIPAMLCGRLPGDMLPKWVHQAGPQGSSVTQGLHAKKCGQPISVA